MYTALQFLTCQIPIFYNLPLALDKIDVLTIARLVLEGAHSITKLYDNASRTTMGGSNEGRRIHRVILYLWGAIRTTGSIGRRCHGHSSKSVQHVLDSVDALFGQVNSRLPSHEPINIIARYTHTIPPGMASPQSVFHYPTSPSFGDPPS